MSSFFCKVHGGMGVLAFAVCSNTNPAPSDGRIDRVTSLQTARAAHTATALRSGQLLVTGGMGPGGGSFHSATILSDGRVLIVGGHRGRREAMEVYASAEIYDPATRRFQAAGSLTTARHKHDAALLADGRVLVIAGADRTDRRHFATTELYDPGAGTFTAGPPMRGTRYKIEGTTVRLASGDLLVTSGSREAEMLDRKSFTFRPVAGEFPEPYYFATATQLPSGEVAIVGGYDPRNRITDGVWLFRGRAGGAAKAD